MLTLINKTKRAILNFKPVLYINIKGQQSNVVIGSVYETIINGVQGYYLWGVVFVLIAYLGCIGNTIIILALRKDPVKTTLSYLLISLSVSDILAPQANALLGFSFYHLSPTYGDSIEFLQFENILRFIIHPLSTMFTMSSSWIVTLTTLFRLIAVKYPFTARRLINKQKAVRSLMAIFGVSLVSITPLYTHLKLTIKKTPDQTRDYVAFEMKEFNPVMKKAYTPFIQTMCFYLPWSLALIFWIFLIKSLRKSSREFGFDIVSRQNSRRESRLESSVYLKKETYSQSFRMSPMRDSGMSNVGMRSRSYNKITLMVSVLCFTNLICRVFTFCFVFEVIFNEFFAGMDDSFDSYRKNLTSTQMDFILNITQNQSYVQSDLNQSMASAPAIYTLENAKSRFPIFFSYSLLLNNIFLCIDHSINIFIYWFTNPRFKRDVFALFRNRIFLKIGKF